MKEDQNILFDAAAKECLLEGMLFYLQFPEKEPEDPLLECGYSFMKKAEKVSSLAPSLLYEITKNNIVLNELPKTLTLLKSQTTPIKSDAQIFELALEALGGNSEIALYILEALRKASSPDAIATLASNESETTLECAQGVFIHGEPISSYFIGELTKPKLFITDKVIQTSLELLPILDEVTLTGQPLLILAQDVHSEALATLIINKLQGRINVAAVKNKHPITISEPKKIYVTNETTLIIGSGKETICILHVGKKHDPKIVESCLKRVKSALKDGVMPNQFSLGVMDPFDSILKKCLNPKKIYSYHELESSLISAVSIATTLLQTHTLIVEPSK